MFQKIPAFWKISWNYQKKVYFSAIIKVYEMEEEN